MKGFRVGKASGRDHAPLIDIAGDLAHADRAHLGLRERRAVMFVGSVE